VRLIHKLHDEWRAIQIYTFTACEDYNNDDNWVSSEQFGCKQIKCFTIPNTLLRFHTSSQSAHQLAVASLMNSLSFFFFGVGKLMSTRPGDSIRNSSFFVVHKNIFSFFFLHHL
jgi:hypothetical protein